MQFIHYPFSEKQQVRGEQKTIVILDCLLLSSHSVNIPKMSVKNAKQAVIYALEDELLQNIDELSIFPNKEADDSWSAIVIEKDSLSKAKDEIGKRAINCLALIPEFMRLPVVKDKISYIEQDDAVLFRISKFNGGKINKTLFFELYKKDNLTAEKFGEHYAEFNLLKVGLWETYGKQIKQFKASAALLVIIFVLNLVGLLIENQQLSRQLEVKITQNETLFRSSFPDITRIVDLQVQLESRLVKVNKWQQLLSNDLLWAMSKHQFNQNIQSIKFDNRKLQVLK